MSLYNWLLANRTKEELAKMVATEASKNARLEDLVHELQHQVFWMEAVDRTPELKPHLPFLFPKQTIKVDKLLTYEEFKQRYIHAYASNGDNWTKLALESSWQAYVRDPGGHFIHKTEQEELARAQATADKFGVQF